MDLDILKEVLDLFKSSGVSKLQIKEGEKEILLEKSERIIPSSYPVSTMKELSDINLEQTIDSPMVGTFYRAISPESSPFVEVGSRVKKGQTLCVIEAMKVMNEVIAEKDCLIKEIKVKDKESAEFGQPLFIIE